MTLIQSVKVSRNEEIKKRLKRGELPKDIKDAMDLPSVWIVYRLSRQKRKFYK